MGLRINQNIAAFNSYRNLSVTQGQMSKSLEKLSSGFRINRAADDAAGLAISEGLRSQIGGLKVAVRNAQDGISVVRPLKARSPRSTPSCSACATSPCRPPTARRTPTRRPPASASSTSSQTELTRIADNTKFNGVALLDGSRRWPSRSGSDAADTIDGHRRTTPSAAVDTSRRGRSPTAATVADRDHRDLDPACRRSVRSQNRFEHTINNLNVAVENLSASESRIRDTDMASEMVNFTRSQILSQAGTAMLAQANQAPQGVLCLLR